MALEKQIFGTDSALNGAIDHAFNMVNFAVGTGQQGVNALLGVPVPADFNASLLVSGPGDVFGGVQTGGLLGAVEQKFLLDASVLSLVGFPFQVTLNGGLAELGAQPSAALTGSFNGGLS